MIVVALVPAVISRLPLYICPGLTKLRLAKGTLVVENAMKFARTNQRHHRQREALSARYGPQDLWSVADHWPLYCSIDNLARFMALADLFRTTLSVPGHIAEFGSWRCTSLLLLAKLLRLYDPHRCMIIYCFDSFEGLTELSVQDGDPHYLQGR